MSDLLSDADDQLLRSVGYEYEATVEANLICLVIHGYRLPAGYDPTEADLLLRLPMQFPSVAPDMFWLDPAVTYAGGAVPPATEVREPHLGRMWQRWSRHFTDARWRPGVDDLRTYLALIGSTLKREVNARAA